MNFWGPFSLLVFLNLMIFGHFDAFLDFFLTLMHMHLFVFDESFPLLMDSLLDETCIPLGMMNFGLFKLDVHFFSSHIDRISFTFP